MGKYVNDAIATPVQVMRVEEKKSDFLDNRPRMEEEEEEEDKQKC